MRLSALVLLAQDAPVVPTTGKGPEWGKAAPIALLIILLMGLALFALIRSMNRQLKKVPSEFMRGTTTTPAVDPAGPGATTGAPPRSGGAAADAAPPSAEADPTARP